MKKIEEYFELVYPDRRSKLIAYHNQFISSFNIAKGSESKHQAWEGGYRIHLEQCLTITKHLYELNFGFTFDSVILVLYFHDIEKMFKYGTLRHIISDKSKYYEGLKYFKIIFSEEELNALKYIHGEGDDYCNERKMNELAAFCHSCDIISARCYHSIKNIEKRYYLDK